jgi:hypothetical protein
MPRMLVALVALLSFMGAAHSETPPPTVAVHAALFTPAHTDNRFLKSRAAPADSARSMPVALTCCKICSVGKACGDT